MGNEPPFIREYLQATVEELETANDEFQATNEALVTSNEELQSTNEDLHSVNEELDAVHAEFQRKIVELTELTDAIENLLRSTEIGVVILDRELRISPEGNAISAHRLGRKKLPCRRLSAAAPSRIC